MAGVKKAVKSPPSFAAFGNELEAAAAVSGYSTVSPPNCITAYCTLEYFPKGPFFCENMSEKVKRRKR